MANGKGKPDAQQSGPFTIEAGDRLDAYTTKIKKREGEPDKTIWTKIGAAWVNRDGSINVDLDALPLDGKIHLRFPRNDEGDQS